MPDTNVQRKPTRKGPLSGLTFAVKDLFDVRGHTPSCGHPEYKRTHGHAERDAPVVRQLLDAGAQLEGVTVMDELAYSLAGENPHYGTPHNTAAPDRVCGGSSSGSAAVTAAGLVDFALGTDTGGSIRVPASFCGLFGLRPTHGRISLVGAMPLAPSFDTVGWLARDATTLTRVGEVLLGHGACCGNGNAKHKAPQHLLLAEDAFALLDNAPRTHLLAAVRQVTKQLLLEEEPLHIAHEGLDAWYAAFRRLQAREIWAEHGEWVERYRPQFGPGVRERFVAAESLAKTREHAEEDDALRESVRCRMRTMLPEETLLVLPAAPGPAPLRGADPDTLRAFRDNTMHLTCPAGLAGLPQVTIPLGQVGGLPLGLSLAAAPDQDMMLLHAAGLLDHAARKLARQTG